VRTAPFVGVNHHWQNVMLGNKSTSLTNSVLGFEKLVKGWRRNESEEDFHCAQDVPTLAIKYSQILRHASKVYTHKIYKIFEKEFLDGCGATSCHEISLCLDFFSI
jgi:hypothetical protein